jgi:hypothetical protein
VLNRKVRVSQGEAPKAAASSGEHPGGSFGHLGAGAMRAGWSQAF